MSGFRYALRLADGSDLGEAEYAFQPQPGDEVYLSGTQRVRVLAVVPEETVAEFVSRPLYGLLEVEPLA